MTLSLVHDAAPEVRPASRPTPFLATLALWLERASRRVALRRARRELLEMPDFMLADIGISRGEIASAVRCGRPVSARR